MKRISILASGAAFSLSVALLAQGCSSAEDDPDTVGQGGTGGQVGGGQGGTAGAPAGTGGTAGAPAGTGGTAGAPAGTGGSPAGGQGGSPAAGGQGGTATAGGGGGGGAPGAPTTCVGSVTNGSACTVNCIDPCGVFQLGTRLCTCTNLIAACVTCEFAVEDPLLVPPTAAFTACVSDDTIMEGLDQTAGYTCPENDRCQSIRADGGANRFCACRGNEWDCDSKPDTFTF